jgi:hypothetical protein
MGTPCPTGVVNDHDGDKPVTPVVSAANNPSLYSRHERSDHLINWFGGLVSFTVLLIFRLLNLD